MYLLDTNVISATAPTKAQTNAGLAGWLLAHSSELYLSVITIAEIEAGLAKARRLGAQQKAARLAQWFAQVLHLYSARILPIDLAIGRTMGQWLDAARAAASTPDMADIAIGATALRHDFTLVTLNTRHFEIFGVKLLDPSGDHPPR